MAKFRHLALLLLLGAILVIAGCSSNDSTASADSATTGLTKETIDSEAFKDLYPLQYNSYLKTEDDTEDTPYSGSIRRSKFMEDKEPLLPIIFNGYLFALDYKEDRGHAYANIDIVETQRMHENQPGACLTCKSSAVPVLIEEMGDGYWGGKFLDEIFPRAEELGHSPIGCTDCHEPTTMDLRITRPSFTKGMESQGIDMSNPTKNEMRSYVCGQCHVEYYFEPDHTEVVFPWNEGFTADAQYEHYQTVALDRGFAQDWIHNVSGAPMLKAQHPDFETHTEGPHGKAGVSCADCHMPYERVDGKKKISSHWLTSPFKHMEKACGTCHANRDIDELRKRVDEIQDTHVAALHKAQDTLVRAHYYINKMITTKISEDKVKDAQQLVREAQWFADFVAAESAAGFHNPQDAMDWLKKSADLSNEIIQLGTVELVKAGVDIDELEKEIEKVKKAVQAETEDSKKKDHATNSYFPPQQPKK